MTTRYFNWKLATVFVVGISVFFGAAYALNRWQVNTRAVQALPLGEEAYARQDYDEAAIQLGKYIAVNMDDVEVLLKYGDAQLKRRPATASNVQQAIAAYRSVLRLDGRNLEAARRLTEVYLSPSMGAPGEAELIAERYLETTEDLGLRRMLADALWQQRKLNEAVAQLRTILEKHPQDVRCYERMGALAEQDRDVTGQPAAFWFDDAVAKNPQIALAYIARADFRLRRGDREKALADLAQAQKCDLSETETRLRLVGTLMDADRLDQARAHLKGLQAKDPTEPLLWHYWADLALRANDPQEMYTVAQTGLKTLAVQPWDFMPVATDLLIRSDHLAEAEKYITQMRQKDIAPPATAFLEGLMADKRGQAREAVACWRKATTLGYRQPLAYVMLAAALSRLGDTQSAVGELRILTTQTPGYVPGHMALAQYLVQARDWPGVLEEARQVQQLSPSHTEAQLLEIQARVHILAADQGPTAEREKAWQEIESRLAQLEQAADWVLEVKLLEAQTAMIRGRLAEAASRLQDLARQNPSETKVTLLQAELEAAQGNQAEAEARFREAMAKTPQALEPVQGLALLLAREGRVQECESVLKDAIGRLETPRLRRDLSLLLADFYRQWHQDSKLDQWLNDLAARFADDVQPRRLLLTRDTVLQDPRRAQSLVDEIKSLEGEAGWQWRYEQARLWNRAGKDEFQTYYPQIVKLLQENLLANPKDHASRLLLADTYEKANDLSLAVTTYKEASDLLPTNVSVLTRTIRVLNQVKDYAEVRRRLDQADRLNLHDPELDKLRLQEDIRLGRLASAGAALEKIVSRDPNDTNSRLNLAWIRLREKKYDEAREILEDLRTRLPDALPVIAAQIELAVQQGQASEALRLCDQTVERLPSVAAYSLRAKTYIALQRYEKALDDFGRIIALEPQKAEGWAARAEFYRMTHRVPEGIADIRRALSLAPDNPAVQRLAVLLLLSSGDLACLREAQDILDKALAAFGTGPAAKTNDPRAMEYAEFQMLQAQVFVLKGTPGDLEEARRVLREVTNNQPRMAQAWQVMAQLELSQDDPGKALDVALRGLAHNPDNGPLLLLKARAEKARTPAIAALTLKGLLDQNPGNIEILIELADAYARSGRTQEAVDLLGQKLPELGGTARRRCEIAYAEALYANGQKEQARSRFDTLMQAEPNDPAPTMTLAQELRRERRWTEMNQLVQRWLTAHPKDAEVATTIARVLAATGDRQALAVAEDILRTTLARNPQSVPTLMLLSMLMQDAGRNEEATRLSRRILALDPNNVIAMNNLAWMLCEPENRPDQYEEALALAEKSLRIVPDYVDVLDTRGYARYRRGDLENAAADFARCTELYPADSPSAATPRFHLALVYAAMKRRTEAAQQLQAALQANLANLRSAKEQADSGRVTYAIKVLREALSLQERMEPLKGTLNLSGPGCGPSADEVVAARVLLEQLLKGNY
jgi:tetratricopeptide (TPR) repeat protein